MRGGGVSDFYILTKSEFEKNGGREKGRVGRRVALGEGALSD